MMMMNHLSIDGCWLVRLPITYIYKILTFTKLPFPKKVYKRELESTQQQHPPSKQERKQHQATRPTIATALDTTTKTNHHPKSKRRCGNRMTTCGY